jgi:hypothetical protein
LPASGFHDAGPIKVICSGQAPVKHHAAAAPRSRIRALGTRASALVAVNGDKQPSGAPSDEYQLAAMNQDLGITTLLLPAKPSLVSVSSTVLRELGA